MSLRTKKTLLAWHFAPSDGRLGYDDGREIKVGETLAVKPPIALCERGLHASVRAIDALRYASGDLACRVELSGKIVAPKSEDKAVATERTVLAMVDATLIMPEFIRFTLVYRQPAIVSMFRSAGLVDAAQSVASVDMENAEFSVIRDVFSTAWAAASVGAAAAAWDAVNVELERLLTAAMGIAS